MIVIRRGIAWLLDILFLSIFFFPAAYLYSGKWIIAELKNVQEAKGWGKVLNVIEIME